MLKKYTFFMMLTMLASFVNAQQFSTLGKLKRINYTSNSIELSTTNGQVRITPFSDNIFRIRIVKDQFGPDVAYAVIARPEIVNYTRQEDAENIFLKTSTTVLKISKNPVRFTFLTLDGRIINEDDPALGTNWNGTEVTTCKILQADEHFIGLGEKAGNFDRRGNAYWHWNTDNPRYDEYSDPLYSTIPFYIGLHSGLTYGIFFDNTYKSYFNFGASQERFSSFGADDGEMDYYFIHGENVAEIIKNYTWLTGRMELPPMWALGNQQCRWSYYPDSEVLGIAATFRDKKIPADNIYLDIHYMDAYKIFTWHPQRFPHPDQLVSNLKKMGFHTTVIIDPGIKVEKGYAAYEDGLKQDMFIKYPDGEPYQGQVWPGWCHFTDYTKPAARQWWGKQFASLVELGIDGFWNDMNEIATWGSATPTFIHFDWEGHKATYRQAKNIYGMLMARSTYEGTKELMHGNRPFILTRSGYAGMQRYTSIWTGDNQANDNHMLLGIRLVNSIGLSGVAFTGYDIGGFGGDATPALYARWISLGALSPFCRTHSAYNTKSSEPWSYGEDVEDIARNYINLRYRLLPYLYSLFYEASQTGIPVQRALAIEYAQDPRSFYTSYQNQYTLGPSLLVAPCKSTDEYVKVFLPQGNWFNIYNDELMSGNNETIIESPLARLPVFVKAGSIIPVHPVRQHTGEDPGDTLEIHLYYGKGLHEFVYYEDDGLTYNYKNGEFYKRTLSFNGDTRELTLSAKEGALASHFHQLKIVLHGFEKLDSSIQNKVNYQKISVLPQGFGYTIENPCITLAFDENEIKIKL
ncbi:MAG TPA: glycoside hydrolase family 31 protein [Bacteroidales bacterium]|nr:glycoside hydrolase family 31 protein [Bacteroidales bacterium]